MNVLTHLTCLAAHEQRTAGLRHLCRSLVCQAAFQDGRYRHLDQLALWYARQHYHSLSVRVLGASPRPPTDVDRGSDRVA